MVPGNNLQRQKKRPWRLGEEAKGNVLGGEGEGKSMGMLLGGRDQRILIRRGREKFFIFLQKAK